MESHSTWFIQALFSLTSPPGRHRGIMWLTAFGLSAGAGHLLRPQATASAGQASPVRATRYQVTVASSGETLAVSLAVTRHDRPAASIPCTAQVVNDRTEPVAQTTFVIQAPAGDASSAFTLAMTGAGLYNLNIRCLDEPEGGSVSQAFELDTGGALSTVTAADWANRVVRHALSIPEDFGVSAATGCDRPSGYPADVGYIGDIGACAPGMVCVVEPFAVHGLCLNQASIGQVCTLSGTALAAGATSWSDQCENPLLISDAHSNCVIAPGAWMGLCQAPTGAFSATGTIPSCNDSDNPELDYALAVGEGEVLHFAVGFTGTSDLGGYNAATELVDAQSGTTLFYGGNPLGLGGGAIYEGGGEATLDHAFRYAGSRRWRIIRTNGCAPASFSLAYQQEWPSAFNTHLAQAIPLASGQPASGLLGCSEQLGVDDPVRPEQRYYTFVGAAGQALALDMTNQSAFPASDDATFLDVTLLDSQGEPVLESLNPVATSATRKYVLGASDRYYLQIAQGAGCTLARFTMTYTLGQ